ncbi:hypothetical protein SUGI_0075240 [Cryptomeria japonica]|nr:hypothetical protein SUGI_0075240 [Cryptomeria japonica]
MKEGFVVYYFMLICILAISAEALNDKDISVAHGQMGLHGEDFNGRRILGDKLGEAKRKKEIRFFPEGYKSESIKEGRAEIWFHQSDYHDPTTHPVTPSP